MRRCSVPAVGPPAFPDSLQDLKLLFHAAFQTRLPDQLLDLTVDALKLLLVLLSVLALVLFQSLQLLRLPHGPVIAFRGLFCPVSIHIPDHGGNQFIFDALESFCKVVLIMAHSETPLPQHPASQIPSSDDHRLTVL